MNYQWYPGHMTKAKRMMQENIKLIDLVIELVDARIPFSSRNPDIDNLAQNKSRILLLNKADLADAEWNKKWSAYFKGKGLHVVEINSKSGAGIKAIQGTVQEACKEKIERDRKRGIINRPVRAMVVGIPNVGKSTFINSFAGKACTKTGNKPGVTKGKQWIRLNKGLELLDTPGILWPKFEEQAVGMRLAFIGSMNDDILHVDELAMELIYFLWNHYPGKLEKRYGLEKLEEGQCKKKEDALELLQLICKSRHCYLKGEELDIARAAAIVVDDFRSGKLGRITLEFPDTATQGI
ncbi:MAG: ribosome biogenesis GTPase YlqF [Lachnospiraceae bacterium]|jgi:ribosome biogenesis GTPase A|nr:ribosome biogenesis GTPase YlqF [Lachnospiraceae bacterium]